MSEDEKSFDRALWHEFEYQEQLTRSLNSQLIFRHPNWQTEFIFKILFKPNAFINREFPMFMDLEKWSHLPADQHLRAEPKDPSHFNLLDFTYNPVGSYFSGALNRELNTYKAYFYRLNNADGLIRLVKIKQQIRLKKIPKDQIENFIKQDIPYFKNPYTNKPMSWYAKNAALYFNDPTGKMEKIEIKLP